MADHGEPQDAALRQAHAALGPRHRHHRRPGLALAQEYELQARGRCGADEAGGRAGPRQRPGVVARGVVRGAACWGQQRGRRGRRAGAPVQLAVKAGHCAQQQHLESGHFFELGVPAMVGVAAWERHKSAWEWGARSAAPCDGNPSTLGARAGPPTLGRVLRSLQPHLMQVQQTRRCAYFARVAVIRAVAAFRALGQVWRGGGRQHEVYILLLRHVAVPRGRPGAQIGRCRAKSRFATQADEANPLQNDV